MNEEPQRDSDAEPAAPSANETGTPSEPGRSPSPSLTFFAVIHGNMV